MKAWKCFSILLVLTLVLVACTPFIFNTNSLKDLTLTYYFSMGGGSSNGHDKTILTFDKTGTAGTFEAPMYTYDYATQAAVASGKYTDKSWFQNSGYKGTFTYDPKTCVFEGIPTQVYAPKPGATPIQTSPNRYAALDYSYQDMKVTVPGATSASMSSSTNMMLTQDGYYMVFLPGSAADSWINNQTLTTTYTVAGVTSTGTTVTTETMTIQSGSIVVDLVRVYTTTVGSTTTKSTYRDIYNFSIQQNFIVGQEDKTDETFADVWKKGNKVTFHTNLTRYSDIYWTGDTPPTAPTVDPTTGFGSSSGAGYYYDIDSNVDGDIDPFNLTHAGDYIMYTYNADFAARNIARGK